MKKIPIFKTYGFGNAEFMKEIPVAWAANHCPMAGVRWRLLNDGY